MQSQHGADSQETPSGTQIPAAAPAIALGLHAHSETSAAALPVQKQDASSKLMHAPERQ
jgi:hypothetical protein